MFVYMCVQPGSTLGLTQGQCVKSFLMAFRHFSSRRGLPSTLTSDSGKTFQSVSKEIQALSRSQDVLGHLANNRITWAFIMERALHGGVVSGRD